MFRWSISIGVFIAMCAIAYCCMAATAPPVNFSLTQANDWAMLSFVLKGGFVATSVFLTIISGLVGFMWRGIIKRIEKLERRNESQFEVLLKKIDEDW